MKKISFAALTAIVSLSFGSCCTVNKDVTLGEAGPIGSKVGEAKSGVLLGLFSFNGKNATLKQAAENGGIREVKQVEYTNKYILGGLYIRHTTRVYGE